MSMRLALAACLAAGALALTACVTGPYNGTTVSGSVIGKTLSFGGYYNVPNTLIRLEVMTNPTLDPNNNANWALLTTTTTGTSPVTINSTDPLYSWSASAAPVPSAAFAARWPQGGLVRVRAVHPDPDGDFQLVTFDDVTFGDCLTQQLDANADWTTIGLECAGVGSKTAALVSISNIPVPPGGNGGSFSSNGFLGRKGNISASETLDYYVTTGAPLTLSLFKSKYGFPGNEVTATYYNNGDLGLGREMHCKTFLTSSFFIGVACYVTNYSGATDATGKGVPAFNVNSSTVLADAVARQHSFATVAMVYEPPSGSNAVKFIVYDANGVRSNTAQLDSTGNNVSVPNNCLSCHGINASYSSSSNAVSANAKFLPFDPYSFKFSTASGFTFAAQADAIRRLNALITFTNPSPATSEFITGLYAPKAVTDATAVANDDFVPDDWAQVNGSLAGTSLYRGIVKVACRTCHMSATSATLDFADYDDFSTLMPTIKADVCGNPHVMPHAERVMKNFWESGARAYLVTGFPSSTYPDPLASCKP
jgi:hypothetical protein